MKGALTGRVVTFLASYHKTGFTNPNRQAMPFSAVYFQLDLSVNGSDNGQWYNLLFGRECKYELLSVDLFLWNACVCCSTPSKQHHFNAPFRNVVIKIIIVSIQREAKLKSTWPLGGMISWMMGSNELLNKATFLQLNTDPAIKMLIIRPLCTARNRQQQRFFFAQAQLVGERVHSRR